MAQEKENFLGRWSRLKREQAQEASLPQQQEPADPPRELPPVDKLTPESEFAGFMHPKVEDALRRAALRKLFSDPHFNIPDPFEPFSGDWTVGEPITEQVMATLNQARTLLFSTTQKEQAEAADQAKDAEQAYAEEGRRQAEGRADQSEREAKDDEPGRQDT
jgi:hypothetical protein